MSDDKRPDQDIDPRFFEFETQPDPRVRDEHTFSNNWPPDARRSLTTEDIRETLRKLAADPDANPFGDGVMRPHETVMEAAIRKSRELAEKRMMTSLAPIPLNASAPNSDVTAEVQKAVSGSCPIIVSKATYDALRKSIEVDYRMRHYPMTIPLSSYPLTVTHPETTLAEQARVGRSRMVDALREYLQSIDGVLLPRDYVAGMVDRTVAELGELMASLNALASGFETEGDKAKGGKR